MKNMKAKDIMEANVITIHENTSVKEAAQILLDNKIGGAPVVDDDGDVVGMVTEDDLIMRDVKLNFPTYLHFLDGYIYLGSLKKFEEGLKKAVGAKVKEVMSENIICVNEDDSVKDAATILVDKKIGRVPVLKGKKLVGIITKADIMKTIVKS
ncbi:CBS domain-containing protein [Candidatus Oleimmundimicrobium sp.]|uniref:CBS domain-containing protein n=1 Tax=Candidatus Oleimmundimicrobium sp. TaxID=3060597 RepID=UPI00271DA869|nr:CBS domain-containing protein [Candidatus Oleimmundimicrobium sp.]MDO8886021.1 CBS domain-containing protein [Candidatus Oleimmundimicrobium sp.]